MRVMWSQSARCDVSYVHVEGWNVKLLVVIYCLSLVLIVVGRRNEFHGKNDAQ